MTILIKYNHRYINIYQIMSDKKIQVSDVSLELLKSLTEQKNNIYKDFQCIEGYICIKSKYNIVLGTTDEIDEEKQKAIQLYFGNKYIYISLCKVQLDYECLLSTDKRTFYQYIIDVIPMYIQNGIAYLDKVAHYSIQILYAFYKYVLLKNKNYVSGMPINCNINKLSYMINTYWSNKSILMANSSADEISTVFKNVALYTLTLFAKTAHYMPIFCNTQDEKLLLRTLAHTNIDTEYTESKEENGDFACTNLIVIREMTIGPNTNFNYILYPDEIDVEKYKDQCLLPVTSVHKT